ncbi:MAG: hypothetical protein EOP53_14405, partial [Sphingobacteriales bacterium]
MIWNEKPMLRVAILDLYEGFENQGMRCIREILNQFAEFNHIELHKDEFEVRLQKQVPDLNYDIYISTGGPGSPIESEGSEWEAAYFGWLKKVETYNNNDSNINVLVNDDYSNKITTLTFTQPSHGTTSLNADNSINYIPAKDYLGADAFTYYITNEYGVSNTATVNISNVANTTAPLTRWDKTDFTATAFQSFISSTPITRNGGIGITLGGETNPRTYYIETSENSTNLDPNRYIQ